MFEETNIKIRRKGEMLKRGKWFLLLKICDSFLVHRVDTDNKKLIIKGFEGKGQWSKEITIKTHGWKKLRETLWDFGSNDKENPMRIWRTIQIGLWPKEKECSIFEINPQFETEKYS